MANGGCMGALNEVKDINGGVEYVSDNPRKIGGITFTAVKNDVSETVDLNSSGQARKYLVYLMVAAISEFSRLFGHVSAMTELQHLIDMQTVAHESEMVEAGL